MSEELDDGLAEELNEFLSQAAPPAAVIDEEEEEPVVEKNANAGQENSAEFTEALALVLPRVAEVMRALPGVKAEKKVVLGIAAAVRSYIETVLVKDLDAFAEHGKRKVIAPADVLLLVRRNPRIHDAIKANAGEPAPKKAKKKGAAAATSAADAAE